MRKINILLIKLNHMVLIYVSSFFLGPVMNYYFQSQAEFIVIEKTDDIININPNNTKNLDPVTIVCLAGVEVKRFFKPTRFISHQFSSEKQFSDQLLLSVLQTSLKISL